MTNPCPNGTLVQDGTVGTIAGLRLGAGNIGRRPDGTLEATLSAWRDGMADDDPGRFFGVVVSGATFTAAGTSLRVQAIVDGPVGDLPGSSQRAVCVEVVEGR